MKTARATDIEIDWKGFARRAKREAAERNRRFLALGAAIVVGFTLFDVAIERLAGSVLWTRLMLNGTVLVTLGGLAVALGTAKWAQRVFGILFAFCAVVMATQAYSLGVISPAPGRLGLHFSSVMALTMIGVQWFWPWQLALGALCVGLFAATVPPNHPDYGFYLVTLSACALLTALFARSLIQWRYQQYTVEAELRRANEIMSAQTAQLEAKNADLTDFLFILSHDLRAPLINLQGFSTELERSIVSLDGALTPRNADQGELASVPDVGSIQRIKTEIAESQEFIRRAVAKMSALVNGILELSRIESRPGVEREVDLSQVVDEVIGLLGYQVAERGIDIQVDKLPKVPGDPLRLGQVFGNLLDNAVKYMKPEGEARIEVRYEARNGDHVFSVRDSGIGVRDEDQKKIFRLFTRLGADGPPGDGIGLAAVKRIVEKNGGRVWVDSQLGAGSTFSFTLPREGEAE